MNNNQQSRRRFRPLEEELRLPGVTVTAGFHDMDRAYISSTSITDVIVMQHEMQHDVALTETNYGIIQSIFRTVYENSKTNTTQNSIAKWSSLLCAGSRHSHEALATYLTIKGLPYQLGLKTVEELPEEYKGYYDILSLLIDNILPTTFLQYMVGKIMIEICFSSRLIEKMLKWQPETPVQLHDDDVPDRRLERLLPVWHNHLPELRTLLSEKCPQQNFYTDLPHSFNILSEQDWVTIPLNISQQIDDWLNIECRFWMYPICETVVPCSVKTEWFDQRKHFIEHMNKFSTISMTLEGTKQEFLDESSRQNFQKRIWRSGRTIISNPIPSILQLKALKYHSLMNHLGLVRNQEESGNIESQITKYDNITFISEQPDVRSNTHPEWGMFQFLGEQCVGAYSVDHRDFIKLISPGVTFAKSKGFNFLGKIRIIVGLWATQQAVNTSLMQELAKAYSIGSRRISMDNVIWYMGGDFINFYKFLVAQGGLEGFYSNPYEPIPELANFPLEEIENFISARTSEDIDRYFRRFTLGSLWLIFRSPFAEGLFLRIMTPWSNVLTAISEDVIDGKIRLFEKSEMKAIWKYISDIQLPIFARWAKI